MDVLTKKQSLSVSNTMDSDISTEQILEQTSQFITCTDINFDDDSQSTIADYVLKELLYNEASTDLFNKNQFITILPSSNQTLNMDNKQLQPNNPKHNNFDQQIEITSFSSSIIDSAILPQKILYDHDQFNQNVATPNSIRDQSKSVAPIVVTRRKIQMKCQPRSKFRPRTQNESKNSAHYLRCDEGAIHDYPAIYVPPEWAQQSDSNIIEVALVDIDKHPHLYAIDNKAARSSLDDNMLIFKKDQPSVLYFRLSNDDFLAGFKTFMIELIKSKQDDVITKKVIRSRHLNQSMLRFTRIYRDQYGTYHRDVNSQEYSCIMTESYGTVSVEHIGPQIGPMNGREMMFILFKGRIVKDDLSFTIVDPTSGWSMNIKPFMINGSLIYFTMPNFPNPKLERANVRIEIYFKKEKIHEATYLYLNLLDQELGNLNSDISSISNDMDRIRFDVLTTQYSAPLDLQKMTKSKSIKRLNTK